MDMSKSRIWTTSIYGWKNIIRILELAVGEDAVMQLANGDIKGNVAQLLKMSKVECLQMIALVDNVYQNEEKHLWKNTQY